MLLHALLLLLHLSVASSASCNCSPVFVPVHVDVFVPKDPADGFAGLKSNSSSLSRVDENYNIYGVFCRPEIIAPRKAGVLQLLVHGITYNNQYWSPSVEEFQNYSYTAFACDRGLSSLAVDWLGVGLSTRPANSSDMQYPTVAAALSQVARHTKTASLLPGVPPFKTLIGIGHSAGAAQLNFGAIVDGAQSPFAALILTSEAIDGTGVPVAPSPTIPSARDDTPLRWGTLDAGYITVPNRSIFYPADPAAFSPRMELFDAFTRDVASVSTAVQTATVGLAVPEYAGRVAKIFGSADQLTCAGTRQCEDVGALTAAQSALWPAAENFELVVLERSGHDLNLDFSRERPSVLWLTLLRKFRVEFMCNLAGGLRAETEDSEPTSPSSSSFVTEGTSEAQPWRSDERR
ncbi:hypothetical protein B0H13DRAFT_1654124 [Mycena leptocephala]|nr:hypothetical protein B0H13DRAFT_1654124 [Mycena leptocephala]